MAKEKAKIIKTEPQKTASIPAGDPGNGWIVTRQRASGVPVVLFFIAPKDTGHGNARGIIAAIKKASESGEMQASIKNGDIIRLCENTGEQLEVVLNTFLARDGHARYDDAA